MLAHSAPQAGLAEMKSGGGGMGVSKHRKSGRSPKSPKLRNHMKREAERNEKKAKSQKLRFSSVREALERIRK